MDISNSNDYYQANQKSDYLMSNETLYAQARLQFVKKVYAILSLQLLITVVFTICSMYSTSFFNFQMANQWLFWVLFVVMIFTQILMICVPAGRKPPLNFIALLTFTLCEAYFVSFICSVTGKQNGNHIVLEAALMTLGIVIAISLYACFCKTDYTIMFGILFVVFASMLFLLIFSLFKWSPFLTNLYCALGVIAFGIYLVIDTQMIMGNKRFGLSLDDYVLGAFILYIDIIQIFLYILQILSKK